MRARIRMVWAVIGALAMAAVLGGCIIVDRGGHGGFGGYSGHGGHGGHGRHGR